MTAFLASKLAKILCGQIVSINFPILWRTDNITPIPKGNFNSQFPLDYRSILITPIIYKVYEKLIFQMLYKLIDSIKDCQILSLVLEKTLALLMHSCCWQMILQSSLDKPAVWGVVSLDFSSTVNLF